MASSAVVGILRVMLTASSAELETELKRAGREVDKFSKDLGKIGRDAQAVGTTLTKSITLPLVGLAAGSIKAAMDFESSFAGILKTVDDATDEFGNLTETGRMLQQGMRDLAKEIPVNVNELNRIGEAAGQLGIESQNIVGFTEVMAKLGVTTNLSSDEAAMSLARLAAITQMPQTEFDRLGATIVGLGNRFETTESEIVDFGLRIAGAAKIAGLAEHEILAIGAAMSSVGVQAESGGTSVQKVLNSMTEAVATGNDKLAIFASTAGMTAEEFAARYRVDAAGAFQEFVEGLGRQGDQAFGTLNDLSLGNERVIRAFLSLAGAGDKLAETFKVAKKDWEDNIALSKEAEQRFKTFENQLKLLWAQVRDVGITLGDSLLPTMRDLLTVATPIAQAMGAMATMFAALPEPLRLSVVGFLGLVAAVGPVTYAFGTLASGTSTLVAALGAKGIATRAVTAALPFLGTAATGAAIGVTALKVALAGLGIGLVVTGLAMLVEKMREVGREVENTTGKPIKGFVDGTGRMLMTIDEAKEKAASAGQGIISGLKTPLFVTMEQARQTSAATSNLGASAETLTGKLAELKAQVSSLTAEQLREIEAGDKAGLSTKELTEAFNTLFPAVKMSEAAMKMAVDQIDGVAKAADKAAAAQKKFLDSVKTGVAAWVPYKAAVSDSGDALQNLGQGLTEVGTLRSHDITETAEATKAAKDWAKTNRGELAPSIKSIADELDAAINATQSFGQTISGAFAKLPSIIQRTFIGGGGLAQSIGASFGSSIFGEDSALVKSLTGGLTKVLGKTVGGALGTMLPGIGTMIGAGAGALMSKVVGGLFGGGEGKQVNDLRDKFTEAAGGIDVLAERAASAGLTLERFYRAKTVKEYEAAIRELNGAFAEHEANIETAGGLVSQIIDLGANGIPAAFGPAIQQLADLGLVTDDQLAKIRSLGDEGTVNVDKMRSAMDVFKGRVESLGPAFRQAEIDKTAAKYVNAIDTMTRGGGNLRMILDDAKEEFSELVAEALKSGTTLPANMQPWIESLMESGKLVDENGQKITDISKLKFGDEIKTEAEIAREGWDRILEAIETLIDRINGPLADAITNIPDGTARINVRYIDPGAPDMDAGYATGTLGRHGSWFRSFPKAGLPTRLHGTEAVITPEQAPAFAMDVIRDLFDGRPQGLSGEAGGGTTAVAVTVNAQGAFLQDYASLNRLAEMVSRAIEHRMTGARLSPGFAGVR